jgi:hypothetical protein
MFYFSTTNVDGTEGRGWRIPTLFTEDYRVALWAAHSFTPFYDQVENAFQTEGDKFTFTPFYNVKFKAPNEIVDMPEVTEKWAEYVELYKDDPDGLPDPDNAIPKPIFVLGIDTIGHIGTSKQNRFSIEGIYHNFEDAVKAAYEKDELGYKIYALKTNKYYAHKMFSEEPVWVQPTVTLEEAVVAADTEAKIQQRKDELTTFFTY